MSDSAFTLGEHTEAIKGLQSDVGEIKADVKALLAEKNKRKGERIALATAGGFVGAVAAFAANMVKIWLAKP